MANTKSLKRAMIASLLAMVMTVTMLMGTTFAWFTDSVTSSGNTIKAGTLDVTLEYKENAGATYKDASTGAIFDPAAIWEPGYVMQRYVKIENVGSLDFKFVLTIVPNYKPADDEVDLADVIEAYMFPATTSVTRDMLVTTGANYVGTVADLIADPDGAAYGKLYNATTAAADATKKSVEEYIIVLKMSESAGNEYQNQSVGNGFAVHLLASQLTSESDSFGSDYDTNATYPNVGSAASSKNDVNALGKITIKVTNGNNEGVLNVATLVVDEESVADTAEEIVVTVKEDKPDGNITIADDESVRTFEITATGIKENNTKPIQVYLYVGKDVHVNALYHRDEEITEYSYNSETGNIVFYTTSFSPFSVVITDEDNVVKTENVPVATVNRLTEYENIDLPWNFAGSTLGPITAIGEGQLAAVYQFIAQDSVEAAENNKYGDWICDFYVSVDKNIDANKIILGGNYEGFGWIGFKNPEAVEGGTRIPLLQLTGSPWSYTDIVLSVGNFLCGAAAVDGTLAEDGVILTVELCLVNPDDATDYITVNKITYNFATGECILVK